MADSLAPVLEDIHEEEYLRPDFPCSSSVLSRLADKPQCPTGLAAYAEILRILWITRFEVEKMDHGIAV